MQWFTNTYDFIEKTFFFTLTRKIVGNISFLFLFQIANYYLFYVLMSSPAEEKGSIEALLIVLFICSLLSFVFTVFYMHHLIVKPVKALLDTLNDINHTQGDLSTRLPAFTCDEFSELSSAYNKFATNLSQLIEQIYGDAQSATNANKTVYTYVSHSNQQAEAQKNITDNIDQSVNQVSHSIQEIVTASEQVSSSNQQNQINAQEANQTLQISQQQIKKITQLLGQFSTTVGGLQENAESVRNILTMVEGFADQTNLLALNAAIEAARAGEAGRGFAVVAEEVRSLSAKVADATQQISNFLNQMDTLVSETHKESTRLIEESSSMQSSIADTSNTFVNMLTDFEDNIVAFNTILTSVSALETQQEQTTMYAEKITVLSEEIQDSLHATTLEATKAQELARSTQQGLNQFVVTP